MATDLERSSGSSEITSCLLFENEANHVCLLDIPASVSLAQGHSGTSPNPWLHSCEPRQEPYAPTEPHTAKAKANVQARMAPSPQDATYRDLIRTALREIRRNYDGDWCLPRALPPTSEEHSQPPVSRQRERKATVEPDVNPDSGAGTFATAATLPRQTAFRPERIHDGPFILSSTSSTHPRTSLTDRPITNPLQAPIDLHVADSQATYLIPPRSTFLWRSIPSYSPSGISSIHTTLLTTFPTCTSTSGPGQLDAIILDPPWRNRSADRKRAYHTSSAGNSALNGKTSSARSQTSDLDPFALLEASLLEHITPGGLVLCWITHRKLARNAALRAFRAWGVELVEEWIWAKVAAKGDPVVDLEGTWRRAWEVCLVGRKREDGGVLVDDQEGEGEVTEMRDVKRRVIVAVPDVHSRKPCLKEMLDNMLPEHADLRVLEVFARHLVAGWMSWGDEVLKFQSKEHWTQGFECRNISG